MVLEEKKDGVHLRVKITPKAQKSEIIGVEGDRIKIRIKAIPDKGKANAELIAFLSKTLKIPQADILIVSGQTSRNKTLLLKGRKQQDIPNVF